MLHWATDLDGFFGTNWVTENSSKRISGVKVRRNRFDNGDTESEDDYTFSYGNGIDNIHLGSGFLLREGIRRAVTGVQFVSSRMLYT
jgi:hypothetical protein